MTIFPLNTRIVFSVFIVFGVFLSEKELVAQEDLTLNTIVIDAGHGGKDPGAIGKKSKEKDIVLDVALKLGDYLNEYLPEVEVVYTRNKDVFVPLNKRAEIANKSKADLFVSIHANSISVPSIAGAETFVLGLHRTEENLEVAKKENSVIVLEEDYSTTYEGFDPNSPESYIIFELMQNVHLDQSIHIASMVQQQFHSRVGRKDRGVKQAGFLVLREVAMPSVLVELGFLSNIKEEKFIASEEGKTYLASALFRAIRDYKKEHDAKSNMQDLALLQSNLIKSKVLYRIQVASSKNKIKEGTRIYKKFNDLYEFQEGGYFKYSTGCTSDYNEIVKLLQTVKSDVNDAFVIAFQSDKKIRVSEARKLTGNKE
ncbi:N-acetylmuramoyl-L-alanine amidase family protein [Carboxylicivirga linearis]|uniref:N-acetylmuramoyl-L-alanine amidase n=1 Tax=Carboxylicivirga linearis TaxID=1628157 RepID=A0ABS5JWG5_9BACT|nr:N-acetylmuramoyl-L-alanine amidase [Carboxylicivirga linearis]MBS2099254.1 N-acetylmuramoyl-L-alanine amidase [Carboxylicivirga linearis]